MYPHLHLLVPSWTPNVYLEVRLYISASITNDNSDGPSSSSSFTGSGSSSRRQNNGLDVEDGTSCPVSFSSSSSSQPTASSAEELEAWMTQRKVTRLVVASHPWGKLGGSCLDPVISQYLVSAVFGQETSTTTTINPTSQHGKDGPQRSDRSVATTALLTWNVRGAGSSHGSMGVFGLSNKINEMDQEALEGWALRMFASVNEVRRFGFSFGCWSTLSAPHPVVPSHASTPAPNISSVLLVSPPVRLFNLISKLPFSGRSFDSALTSSLQPVDTLAEDSPAVWITYGTADGFTARSSYVALSERYGDAFGRGELVMRELEGAGHFYRSDEEGQWLVSVMRDWLCS